MNHLEHYIEKHKHQKKLLEIEKQKIAEIIEVLNSAKEALLEISLEEFRIKDALASAMVEYNTFPSEVIGIKYDGMNMIKAYRGNGEYKDFIRMPNYSQLEHQLELCNDDTLTIYCFFHRV